MIGATRPPYWGNLIYLTTTFLRSDLLYLMLILNSSAGPIWQSAPLVKFVRVHLAHCY